MKLVSDEVFERETRSGRYRGTLDEFQRRVVEAGFASYGRRATQRCEARATSSVRAPTCATSRFAGGSSRSTCQCCRTRRPRYPRCRPARSCGRSSASTAGHSCSRGGSGRRKRSVWRSLRSPRSPTSTLTVAGDGPERAALEGRAAELGLEGRVRFLGSVPRATVLRLFRAADASVLPSSWENFPHTVVESLAVGCPVIATAVGGVPEVVRDGENGLLVAPNDPAALAAAISRFFSDAELRARLAERCFELGRRATRRSRSSHASRPSSSGRPQR